MKKLKWIVTSTINEEENPEKWTEMLYNVRSSSDCPRYYLEVSAHFKSDGHLCTLLTIAILTPTVDTGQYFTKYFCREDYFNLSKNKLYNLIHKRMKIKQGELEEITQQDAKKKRTRS